MCHSLAGYRPIYDYFDSSFRLFPMRVRLTELEVVVLDDAYKIIRSKCTTLQPHNPVTPGVLE